jgi:TetR/AcrR family transcriptional regulator, regulator of autoinduction and epiphytic fitness
MSITDVEHPDGRVARAQRTRTAIVDAVLALLEEGDLEPSAESIAARADVSERSIFAHFGRRECLLEAVSMRQAERIAALVRHLPDTGPLEDRLTAFIDQRARVLEFITPTRRAGLLVEHESAAIRRNLNAMRKVKRAEVERVFAVELDACSRRERPTLAAALGAASAWNTWESLRIHQGLSPPEAADVMAETIRALLRRCTEGRERRSQPTS